MKRRVLIFLLAFGTIAGFAAGFARLAHFHHGRHCWYGQGGHDDRHGAFEQRVADVCVRAADRHLRSKQAAPDEPVQ